MIKNLDFYAHVKRSFANIVGWILIAKALQVPLIAIFNRVSQDTLRGSVLGMIFAIFMGIGVLRRQRWSLWALGVLGYIITAVSIYWCFRQLNMMASWQTILTAGLGVLYLIYFSSALPAADFHLKSTGQRVRRILVAVFGSLMAVEVIVFAVRLMFGFSAATH